MDNHRSIRAAMDGLKRRLAMTAARAVVRLVDDGEARQRLQVEILQGELRDGVERAQNYGFTSHPLAGCDAVILCAGGTREQSIAVVVDDRRYRLNLQPGEVAMYDDQGNAVKILRDKIHVTALVETHIEAPTVRIQATTVIIEADDTTINSNVAVNGDTVFTGSVTANGKPIDETHQHTGVQAGGSNSGTVL